MIFTFFYVYATIMQWWRMRNLSAKLSGTLNDTNALLVCAGNTLQTSKKQRSLENLLFRTENRIACTIVPKQKVNLGQWVAFPKNPRYFPIHLDGIGVALDTKKIHVMLQAVLEGYVRHEGEMIQMENYGELVGWKVGDGFEVVVKTDMANLTKLVHHFSQGDVDLNHDLKLLKIETINVEGVPTVIKYEKKYLKEQTLKYSYAPVHWNRFVEEIKELYSKIRDITTPKIKIENGTTKCHEHPKPKKEFKEPKSNTLDVTTSDHRRHKKREEKRKHEPTTKTKDRHKRTTKLVKQSSVVKDEVKVTSSSKPPNILVYADNVTTKDNVKRILFSILNKEKYTIYDLPTTQPGWEKSTVLVVICGGVPPTLTPTLIHYFLSGGKLLCICSDLMYSVLHTFTTAEVREKELVRFSYGEWRHVKMMHHIFCYQASPAKKQFSKDSDHSNHSSEGSSPQAPRTPSNVELKHNERDYNIQVQVLGTEETWQTPSLLLAKVKTSPGRAVFSQVHLEIDPEEYEKDDDKYESLLSSNEVRVEILRDLLGKHLEVDCDETFGKIEYGNGYFLGRFDAKMSILATCDTIENNQLNCEKISVIFCGHGVQPPPPTPIRLPVLIHSCPSNFSTLHYFDTLQTKDVGRLVVYSDIMTSTQHLLSKKLRHGFAVIAKRQSNGVGRGQNNWLSPVGCAAFSMQLHVDLSSNLGKVLPLVQHLVGVAIVGALKREGIEVGVGIKWPNDLYLGETKIGGVVVGSTLYTNMAVVNIGVGVNLSNSNPTICINDVIEKKNREEGTTMAIIPYEKYFAIVFNEIERLYEEVQKEGTKPLFDLYYSYWLHSNAEVTIATGNKQRKATVVGIDQYGYLSVRLTDGTMTSVQPDGNSFDMMSGLIAPKKF